MVAGRLLAWATGLAWEPVAWVRQLFEAAAARPEKVIARGEEVRRGGEARR